MANNAYVNKVVYGNQTLIDISDTTATASDIATGKYFYLASGQKVQGSASGGASVSQDDKGYVVLPTTGDIQIFKAKTITENGTYSASSDDADGYSSVIVNTATANVSTITSSALNWTLTFTGLNDEPKAFFVSPNGTLSVADYSITMYPIVTVCYDGTNISAHMLSGSSSSANVHATSYPNTGTWSDNISFTYSSGTLAITYTKRSTSDYIRFNGDYELTYIY